MEIHNPLLFLFMCLIMSDPSKQGCEDYFNVDEWKSILKSDMINLVNATNFKGKVVCTLKNINMTLYNMVLEDCFEKDWDINCVPMLPNSNVIIHKYHFMCMVYKLYRQFNPVTGNNTDAVFGFCSYESLCKVFAETTNSDGTSSPPMTTTTTTQPRTTTLRPTATLQPPTAVLPARTTLLHTTIALQLTTTQQITTSPTTTTTLPPQQITTTTTLPPQQITTTAYVPTSDKAYPAPGKQQLPDQQHDILKILLVSVTVLAVVLPLFVYLYMRQQMKRQVSHGSVIAMDLIDADSSLLSS